MGTAVPVSAAAPVRWRAGAEGADRLMPDEADGSSLAAVLALAVAVLADRHRLRRRHRASG